MRRARVGDVLSIQRRPVEVDVDQSYTLIGVYSFGKGIFHREAQPGADLGNYKFSRIEPGDLVMSNIQAWEGAIGYATEQDRNTVGTHRFLSYVPINDDEIDASWARYYFLSEAGFPSIQQAAPGSVTRNRTLAQERFEAIELPLPDIEVQRRTAAHLDRVAREVQSVAVLRGSTSARLSALRASLASQPQLSDTERTRRGWRQFQLGELMTESNDVVPVELDKQYPNLGIYSFGRGVFAKPPIDGLETSAKRLNRVRSGQFIYSRLFAFEGAYAYVPPEFDGVYVSGEFPSFDVNPDLAEAPFIAAALRSPRQWGLLAGSSKGLGLRRQRIKVEALLEHRLWFPPVDQQQKVVAGLDRIHRLEGLVAHSNDLSGALLRSALNRAFAGLA